MDEERIIENFKERIERKETEEYWWNLREKAINAKNIFSKAFHMYRYQRYLMKMCANIPIECQIESMPTLPHGIYGTFISLGAKIGRDCVIFQQVTIGSNTLKESKRIGSPTVGDNVYIGTGAKLIGNIKIGNNVRIGANCVVAHDVPDNATVVSERNRIINHDYELDNQFYYYDEIKDEMEQK